MQLSAVDNCSSPYEVKVSQHVGHNPLMGLTTFSQRFPKTIGKHIMIHNGNKISYKVANNFMVGVHNMKNCIKALRRLRTIDIK